MYTRRRFLRACAASAGAVFGTSLRRWSPGSVPADATPARQTLNVGEWIGPTTLDPDVETTDYTIGLLRNVYEPLVDLKGSTLELEGVLATEWRIGRDATEYTFQLRRGVRFSDGTPFNAEAAKFSIERVLQLKKGPYWVAKYINSVEARDETTLVIRLASPFPLLSAMRLIPMISPTTVASKQVNGDNAQEWLSEHSAGTGAYQIERWERGKEWTLVKHRAWRGWPAREASRQTFERVVIKEVLEPSTQLLMLKRGDLDIEMLFNQDSIAELKHTPGIAVYETPTLQQLYIRLNTAAGPTKDVRVRQALNYTWDFKVLDAVLPGAFTQADGPLPNGLLGAAAPRFPYRYDLGKAKQLLAAAGYANGGLTLTYWTVKGDEIKRLAGEALQTQLAKLNIQMQTIVSTWPAQYQALSAWAKTRDPKHATSMFPLFTGPRFPDPYAVAWFMYDSAAASGDGRNWGAYSNPTVDRLIAQAASKAGNSAEEQRLYGQAAAIITEAAPDIFVGKSILAMPMRVAIKGYTPRPASSRQVLFFDLWRV